MSVYADSSFLVSLYLTDSHSREARYRLQRAPALRLTLTALHRAEWEHALGQHQFRGNLTSEAAERIHTQFVTDEASGLFRVEVLPERAFALCAELARRHGPSLAMRTLDSLHVACALELKADRFWSNDERQLRLAKVVGLKAG